MGHDWAEQVDASLKVVTAADHDEFMPSAYDPASFTRERAGVAAVLNGITGIVIRLD